MNITRCSRWFKSMSIESQSKDSGICCGLLHHMQQQLLQTGHSGSWQGNAKVWALTASYGSTVVAPAGAPRAGANFQSLGDFCGGPATPYTLLALRWWGGMLDMCTSSSLCSMLSISAVQNGAV